MLFSKLKLTKCESTPVTPAVDFFVGARLLVPALIFVVPPQWFQPARAESDWSAWGFPDVGGARESLLHQAPIRRTCFVSTTWAQAA